MPTFFAAKLATIATHFLDGAVPRLHRQLCLTLQEMDIVAPLNAVVSLQEHATVSFGSYPVEGHPVDGARTVVTLEVRARVRVRVRFRVRVRVRVRPNPNPNSNPRSQPEPEP